MWVRPERAAARKPRWLHATPTWASELTFCMFLMDALEDAVPEARVIPLNISESSIHERPAGAYTFLIIEA